MSKFDWQTEEDWEELSVPPEEPEGTRPRRWQWLLGLVVIIGLAGYLIYTQVDRRIEEATNTVEQDVTSSLEILQLANDNQDVELANGVLSGRDPDWTNIQRDLIRSGLIFDRTPFGLARLGAPEVIHTELAPDLLSAQLTLHTTYAIEIGNGLTQTITLEHTAIFRKGSRNWLYAPPDAEFWGEMEEISGSFITLHYPARDEEISRRLANDLERKIGELCATLAFEETNCLGGARIDLTLANHAAGLIMANDTGLWLQAGRELVLPAPTLVGLPDTEQEYLALFRGYAVVVLQAFIGERTGWECCERAVLVQALLDRQFAEQALKPWPLLPHDYANLLNQGVLLQNLAAEWDATTFGERDPGLYALADFLTKITQVSAPMTLIPMATGHDFPDWLAALLNTAPFSLDSNRAWQAFLYEQSGMAAAAPPIPWPDQAVSLLCGPNYPDAAALYTYHPEDDTWVEQLAGRAFFTAQPLREQAGLVLVEQPLGAENRPPHTILWRNQQVIPLMDGAFVLQSASHDGDILAGATLALDRNSAGSSFGSFSTETNLIVDVSSCGEDGTCDTYTTDLPNLLWSPDNQLTLSRITRPGSISELRIGDRYGQDNEIGAVGLGTSLYWFDDETVIHLRTQEIIKTNIHTKEAETLITGRDLLPYLPSSVTATRLTVNEIGLSQSDPHLLYVLATNFSELNAAYLFQYNLSDQQISYLTRLDEVPIPAVEMGKSFRIPVQIRANQFQVSVTIVHEVSNPVYYFYSYQIAQNKTSLVKQVGGTNWRNYAWSNDGYWLVSTDSGVLKFIAPGWEYQYWVAHEFVNCRAANWLNE